MIGVLLLTHEPLAHALLSCAAHVLGHVPEQVQVAHVLPSQCPDDLVEQARTQLKRIDSGQGVLILTDIFGASPANLACRLIVPGKVEVVTGANLPMLLRALGSRQYGMDVLLQRVVSGAAESIFQIDGTRAGGPCASQTVAGQMRTMSTTI